MLHGERLALAKGLLLAWVRHCYRRREALAVIGFSGQDARVIKAPGKAVALNESWIAAIPGGGATPANAAVALAERVLQRRHRSHPDEHVALYLLSDLRFPQQLAAPRFTHQRTVIDFEAVPATRASARRSPQLGRAAQLAQAWQADYRAAQDLFSIGPP